MNRTLAAALIGLSPLAPFSAHAASIFDPPPAVLSPDLTNPWMLQLKAGKQKPVVALPNVSNETTASILQGTPSLIRIPGASDAVRSYRLAPEFLPAVIQYPSDEKPGTMIIDTVGRHLYLIMGHNQALRYGVGVGRPGFEWAGVHHVTRMAEWPDWTPPPEMLQRKPELPRHMDGGPDNPLGARALYLGSTLYRIHGSNEPWTIGTAVSSGCIRMRNEDVMDLYQRVSVGAKVIVL
ncbi:MAG TPA: L,D-transpeptidase [Bauldia sp.]|nr:L,D-transpeptidase [Bauldia sp.]